MKFHLQYPEKYLITVISFSYMPIPSIYPIRLLWVLSKMNDPSAYGYMDVARVIVASCIAFVFSSFNSVG